MKSYSRCIIQPGLQKQLTQRECHSRDCDLSCSSDAAQSLMFIPLKCLRDASPRSAQTLPCLFAFLCLFNLGVTSGCIPSPTPSSNKPQTANEQVSHSSRRRICQTRLQSRSSTDWDVPFTFTKHLNASSQSSPETTELLFALGLGERMVGVTEHCELPISCQASCQGRHWHCGKH